MHKSITRVSVAVAAAAALSTLGVTGTSASSASTRAPQAAGKSLSGTSDAAAVPGAQLWITRYNGPGNSGDFARSVAVSPAGDKVFVTGESPGATSVAVARDGTKVFVTGSSWGGSASGNDYATVAYNASTGATLWVKRYNGPANGEDEASSVVSPGNGKVYVTGHLTAATGTDYATVAYSAASGAQLWARRYNGPANGDDSASSLAVNPDRTRIFVTGQSDGGSTTGGDYATVAYNAGTGAQLWARRYNGPANGADGAASVAVSPTGGKVFVTGRSIGVTSGEDYATVAYSAATGTQLWVRRYNGPGNANDNGLSVAIGPAGGKVYVTGYGVGATSSDDYATVAYNATTGTQLWVRRYNGPANGIDLAFSLVVSPNGSRVFVTGASVGVNSAFDYATVAYGG